MNRILLAAIAVAALALPILFDFAPDASAAAPAAASLQTAPDFSLIDLNGDELRMAELRGKVVVVNFWATWCPPCRHEIPWFIDLQNKYGPKGLEIVGISLDSAGRDHVARFAGEAGINYRVAIGNHAVAARYGGVSVLPSTFYVGRDGKVIRHVQGLISKAEIEALVTTALEQPAPAPRAARRGSRGKGI